MADVQLLVTGFGGGSKQKYTAQDDAKILRLMKEGKTAEEIGTALGRTPSSIAYRFYRKIKTSAANQVQPAAPAAAPVQAVAPKTGK